MITPCPRCQGLLVYESFSVPECSESIKMFKCVNCGVVYDPLIMYNQSSQEVKSRLARQSVRKKSSRPGIRKRLVVFLKG